LPRLSSHLAALALVAATLARSTPVAASFPFLRLGQDSGFLYHSFAEALANSFSASGITVYPGTYHECVNVTGFVLFTIVFKKGAILDATGCDAGITISDGEGMTVKGAVIVGAKQGIVVKAAPTRVLISKSTIEDGAADPVVATMETASRSTGRPTSPSRA